MIIWCESRDRCWTQSKFHTFRCNHCQDDAFVLKARKSFLLAKPSLLHMVWIWRDCKTSEGRNLHTWKLTTGIRKMKGLRRWVSCFKQVIFRFHVMPLRFPVFSRCREACASNLAVLGKVDLTPKREREIMQKAIRMMRGFGVFFFLDLRCPPEMPAKCLLS